MLDGEEEESEDEEEEDEEENGDSQHSGQKRRHRDDADGSSKRKRLKLSREDIKERESLIDEYYSGNNGYGKPSSLLVLELCHLLHLDDAFHVW